MYAEQSKETFCKPKWHKMKRQLPLTYGKFLFRLQQSCKIFAAIANIAEKYDFNFETSDLQNIFNAHKWAISPE